MPDPTVPDRTEILRDLTISEKAALCSGADFWHTVAIPRAGIESIMVADGPHGLRVQLNAADHSGAHTSLPATCFPTAAALASSWNPGLIGRVGAGLAQEALAQGIAVILGPGVNIKRSLLCGRNFEYFSEDPCLTAAAATAFVTGVQSGGVGACLKHFAVNNQETDRLRVSAEVHERALREIYLAAFERCVEQAAPWTVMCAYNRINGIPAAEHHWLLTRVLREEWGFSGLVMSDWGAVRDRVSALAAGLDLEMPPDLERSPAAVAAAVASGHLDEAILDRACGRVLELVGRAPSSGRRRSCDFEAHHDLAREAAAEGAVLLKNAASALPLAPAPGATIAVIGEFARTPRYQGAGSSRVNPTWVETFLEEFTARVGDGVAVRFAPALLETWARRAGAKASILKPPIACSRPWRCLRRSELRQARLTPTPCPAWLASTNGKAAISSLSPGTGKHSLCTARPVTGPAKPNHSTVWARFSWLRATRGRLALCTPRHSVSADRSVTSVSKPGRTTG